MYRYEIYMRLYSFSHFLKKECNIELETTVGNWGSILGNHVEYVSELGIWRMEIWDICPLASAPH